MNRQCVESQHLPEGARTKGQAVIKKALGRVGLAAMASAFAVAGAVAALPAAADASTGYGPYLTLASTLNERSAPSTSASIVGSLPYHTSIMIACQTTGSSVNGSQIWDLLTSGPYVADYYVNTPNTGTWSPPIPQCGTPPPPPAGSSISTNGVLHGGQTLVSSGGGYRLAMQTDGNLVEYNAASRPLWDTQTSGNSGAYAVLQSDGNFVVYSAAGKALWASYTFGSGTETLAMQSDGNVVIYSPTGVPLWANFGATAPTGQTIGSNWFPGGQCTWWAEHEAAGYMGVYPDFNGNADQWAGWASTHGYVVGSSPKADSVVVFQPGADGAGSVGHVAWVTDVYPNRGTMTISEMNFVGFNQVDTRTVSIAYNSQVSYIYVNP